MEVVPLSPGRRSQRKVFQRDAVATESNNRVVGSRDSAVDSAWRIKGVPWQSPNWSA